MKGSAASMRLLLTGGGTGGHLFPAVAAAQALQKRLPGSEVLFIGTRRRIDVTGLQRYGFRSCAIDSYGLKGKSLIEIGKALVMLPVSVSQAIYHIIRFRPQVALGVGGYVTGPVMLAARLLGVATVIHEQNSVPGMANRKLGAIVSKICISLPGSEKFFPATKVVRTGNPVRQDLLVLATEEPKPVKSSMLTLLVLGGSQGAHGLNTLVTEAFANRGKDRLSGIQVIHQTGNKDLEWVKESYQKSGVAAEVSAFFTDMSEVYRKADLLISRAGATTLSELAVLGKPAIVVPYPYAADDHQQKNGAYYAENGGVVQFRESDLNAAELSKMIDELANDRQRLTDMAGAMRKLADPDAADKIVDVCLQFGSRLEASGKD